jgi:tRNA uridine 5-carboxymethylaminomethyl modification enzyme
MQEDEALQRVEDKLKGTEELKKSLRKEGVVPDVVNPMLRDKNSSEVTQQVKLSSLITRPNIALEDLLPLSVESKELAETLNPDVVMQTEIQLKYEGYIQREEEVAAKMSRLEDVKIPETMDYFSMKSISSESKEKLHKIRPATIGQASRISGVSPSDISVLLISLGR